jgi:hypothetical protein
LALFSHYDFAQDWLGHDNGRGHEYFDKLCPGKLTWKNAGNGDCLIFDGQYCRHASYIIFVHALWLAYALWLISSLCLLSLPLIVFIIPKDTLSRA